MSETQFEWSNAKARQNLRNHGVSFQEARTVEQDPRLLRFYDAGHSEIEEREIWIGISQRSRLLMVVTTERHEAIRIISARRATKDEARRYEEQR